MRFRPAVQLVPVLAAVTALLAGCGSAPEPSGLPEPAPVATPDRLPFPTSVAAATTTAEPTTTTAAPGSAPPPAAPAFQAGNPGGGAGVPAEGRADTSPPTRTIGTGTPASCTSDAVVAAVAAGGVVAFDCGPDPVTIRMTATAKVVNRNPKLVLDGGGKVTLDGGGARRILYQNTCDQAQGWTTSQCQDQESPQLVVQNIAFANGNSTGDDTEGGGGGAIFVRGGQLKIVNARFTGNRCDRTGPDLGGAAVRVLDQFADRPVHVTASTFTGGSCSNGGALSSIGVSWVVTNSVFTGNEAIGRGANPAKPGTPGGGSGGAIYCDGNRFTVTLAGTVIEDNTANEGGGAVFFVSNDRSGTMRIEGSTLRGNPSGQFETAGYPGIFFLGASDPAVSGSTLR